ncbi:hypothetical protein D3C87_1734140 [compost metagenome]
MQIDERDPGNRQRRIIEQAHDTSGDLSRTLAAIGIAPYLQRQEMFLGLFRGGRIIPAFEIIDNDARQNRARQKPVDDAAGDERRQHRIAGQSRENRLQKRVCGAHRLSSSQRQTMKRHVSSGSITARIARMRRPLRKRMPAMMSAR